MLRRDPARRARVFFARGTAREEIVTLEPIDDLTLDEYQQRAAATDLDAESADPLIPLLGLAGEVGALLAEFKKERRPGGSSYTGFHDGVVTELGDILWYLAALARRVEVPLGRVAALNLAKTKSRWLPSDPAGRPSFDEAFPEDQRLPRQFTVEFWSREDESGRIRVHMRYEGEALGDPIDDNASQTIIGFMMSFT